MFKGFMLLRPWIQTEFFSGVFIFCLFFVLLCFDSSAADTKINDADATNIVLKNIKKIESGGHERRLYPRFSPDGRQILFTKMIEESKSMYPLETIWIMDSYGKNKRLLIKDGYNGVWSPDGSKIAYCGGGGLSIYDIKAKKKFELIKGEELHNVGIDCSTADAAWTKDGKQVVWGGVLINLDTLKTENARSHYCVEGNYKAKTETVCKEAEWRKANLLSVVPPKNVDIYFYDPSDPVLTTPDDPSWLWIGNRDKSFKRVLLPEDYRVVNGSVNISPDLSKIIFEKFISLSQGNAIYIADIGVANDKDLPARTFRVPMGRKKLLEEAGDRRRSCIVEGSVYAEVSDPKINPMNKKTIGHGENKKGLVKLVKIFDDYSIVTVIEERKPISIGDVIWDFRSESCMSLDIWAIIEAKAEWKEEIPKDEEQGEERKGDANTADTHSESSSKKDEVPSSKSAIQNDGENLLKTSENRVYRFKKKGLLIPEPKVFFSGQATHLEVGTLVEYLEDKDGGKWVKLRLANGQEGWDLGSNLGSKTELVKKSDVEIAGEEKLKTSGGKKVIVKRKGPMRIKAAITSDENEKDVAAGTVGEYLGAENGLFGAKNYWIKVRLPNGKEGYFSKNDIEIQEPK